MLTFKSSPLIPHCSNRPRKVKKGESVSKQPQYMIVNPFRSGEQQNFLPYQLIQQIQDMEYISPTSIKKINLPDTRQSQRRSSNFARHLYMMQNAAREQQEKFYGLISPQKSKKAQISTPKQQDPQSLIPQPHQRSMSIQELDDLSIEMQNCLNEMNYREMDDEEFGMFDDIYINEKDGMQGEKGDVFYYSQQEIMHETENTDFDCYLNQ